MAKARKPQTIEVGKCYRLNEWYGLGHPSDVIVYVYAIEGKRQRLVYVKAVSEDHKLEWTAEPYSSFLRRVHSEAPTAKN